MRATLLGGLLLTLLTVAACTRDGGPLIVPLTERVETSDVSRFQLRIDTVDGVPRRRIDSVGVRTNMIRLLNNQRVAVEIPAADLVLDGDSIRLGIIRGLGPAFDWQDSAEVAISDHLLITTWGNTGVPIAMDMENVGPIGRRTVFRIGRRYYALRSFDLEAGEVAIEALPESYTREAAAEFDPRFRRVPVQTLSGEPVTVGQTEGRPLLIYFWGYGPLRGEDVLTFDTLYTRFPDLRERLDLVLLNRHDGEDFLRRFVSECSFGLPLFRALPATCRGLNCRPVLPYGVWVNGEGRVVSYYMNRDDVMRRVGQLAGR